ncbi:hypothetical protein BGZ54_000599, partial [Gamsiella multidivaricata]
MCGILFSVCGQTARSQSQSAYERTWSTLQQLNARRGPSAQDTYSLSIAQNEALGENVDAELTFYGAVLHLRGDVVTRQPHVSSAENILLWNGEVFDGIAVDHHENDGQVLMDQLETISSQSSGKTHAGLFLELMARIEGPYAFVYFHAASRTLYFGRDCLGRRSLLWHKEGTEEGSIKHPFILTSVGYSALHKDLLALDEVPADGIYSLSLKTESQHSLIRYPWIPSVQIDGTLSDTSCSMRLPFGRVNDHVPTEDQLSETFADDLKFDQAHPEIVPPITDDMKLAISSMIEVLGDSVRRRVQDIPRTGLQHDARVGILFSGGLDCLCLAALADRFLPEGEAIDLLNVGFENPRSVKAKAAEEALALKRLKKQGLSPSSNGSQVQSSGAEHSKYNVPDRITGYESLVELRRIAPHRHWNFGEVNGPFEAVKDRGD